ncbi:MAG: class II aldolase/adducin family protein [Spirochaetes bacterium]|nr:class II aldolase/adducin family protein [Spirochaetota bacterium]
MGKYDSYKKQVFDCTMDLVHEGYIQGLGGNVSMLVEGEDVIAVTPSQREYRTLTVDEICVVDFDLKPIEDNGIKPSVETGMHVSVYRNRKDVGAVVHTHQIFASVFALINEPIPCLFDEVASTIGPVVEVVPYGLSGSPQLMDNVVTKLGNRGNCYILQNHGALSLGSDISKAKRNTELLEKCARVYYYALSTGKEINLLPQNMQELMGKIVVMKQDAEIKRREELKVKV